jgi:hypothetical protein
MIRINLTGMHVENDGPCFPENPACHLPNYEVRKESEITAAKETEGLSQDLRDAHRKFG